MKREVYIRLGFCEGGAISVEKRGFCVNRGRVRCPSFGHLAGHGRERERGVIMRELVELCGVGIFGKLEN